MTAFRYINVYFALALSLPFFSTALNGEIVNIEGTYFTVGISDRFTLRSGNEFFTNWNRSISIGLSRDKISDTIYDGRQDLEDLQSILETVAKKKLLVEIETRIPDVLGGLTRLETGRINLGLQATGYKFWLETLVATIYNGSDRTVLYFFVGFDGHSVITATIYTHPPLLQEALDDLSTFTQSFESSYISNPLSDNDGDGLLNYREALFLGSDHNKADTNEDGLHDDTALAYGVTPRQDVKNLVDAAALLGRSEVLSSPASFDLYTESDVSEATSAAKAIVNVSARVALGEGEIVTPGFVVLGEQKKMLIRAVGPKLADLGVESPLPNPTMTVYKTRYDGNPPDLLVTIDDWKADNDNVSEIVSAMSSAGAFPLEPTETFQGRPFMTDDTSSAATLVTLDIGVYTVQVSSADDGVGEVLVEVYEITD
jgi:hypothetical protein